MSVVVGSNLSQRHGDRRLARQLDLTCVEYLALVRPGEAKPRSAPPTGLLAVAGALEDWEDLPAAVADIYSQRRSARDRKPPELD